MPNLSEKLYRAPYFYDNITDGVVARSYNVLCTIFMFICFFLLTNLLGPKINVHRTVEPLIWAMMTTLAMLPMWFSSADLSNRFLPIISFATLVPFLSGIAYLSALWLRDISTKGTEFFQELTLIQALVFGAFITVVLLFIFRVHMFGTNEAKYHVTRLRCYQALVKRLLTKDEEGLRRQNEKRDAEDYDLKANDDDREGDRATLLDSPSGDGEKKQLTGIQKIIKLLKNKFFPFNPHAKYETKDDFFYPSRFLSALFVFVTGLTVNWIFYFNRRDFFLDEFRKFGLVPLIFTKQDLTIAFYTISTVIYLFNLMQAYLLSKSYRREIFRMRQGKYSYDTTKFKISTSANGLVGLMFVNAPFSLAYGMAFGFLIFGGIKAIILIDIVREEVKKLILKFLTTSAIVMVIRTTLNVIINNVFFLPSGWIRFKRTYSTIEYFDTFYSVFTVGVKILKTIILYIFSPMLFLSRPDLSVLPRVLETMDDGHKAFVAGILMDHHHNNPIVLVFTDMLYYGSHTSYGKHYSGQVNLLTIQKRKWAKYWRLLITLHNNPKLVEYRRAAPGKRYSGYERPMNQPIQQGLYPVHYE